MVVWGGGGVNASSLQVLSTRGRMVVVDQQAPLTDDDNTSSSGPVVLSRDVFESNNVR